MNCQFLVRFSTRPGQQLNISGESEVFGGKGVEGVWRAMSYRDGEFWSLEVDIPDSVLRRKRQVSYRYALSSDGGDFVEEWGNDRRIPNPGKSHTCIRLIDTWNHAGDLGNVFLNAPFREVLLGRRRPCDIKPGSRRHTHRFQVKAPLLGTSESLCLTGNGSTFGNWDKAQTLRMCLEDGWWSLEADLSRDEFPLTYKYAVVDDATGAFLRYEDGENRILMEGGAPGQLTVMRDGFARLPMDTWRGAGIAIPVFSLRTGRSSGVGEFSDILPLADWAADVGISMIQLLPVNDTTNTRTWRDSYPYSAISAFALHPLYLDLHKVAGEEHGPLVEAYDAERLRLNGLEEVDYEGVMAYKEKLIAELYGRCADRDLSTEGFRRFFGDNRHWLEPYAAFCHLRDLHGTADYNTWGTHSRYDAKSVSRLCSAAQPHHDGIRIHYFIQYHLHLQLKEAHDHANAKGIILKGDIPIGVNRTGVEAWMEPEQFDLSVQAGAPPDDFAVKGQNWGFPTYDWERMRQDGYAWWHRRFDQMSRYFDAFRIDHILGFFRIWSIPVDAVEGIMGRFVPAIGIDIEEFRRRGIEPDRRRYCEPFITDAVLWEMFGAEQRLFKPYLVDAGDGFYRFDRPFDTQRKVEAHFARLEQTPQLAMLKAGLFDLHANLLLFEEEEADGRRFHFRFHADRTVSFRHLPQEVQATLREMYTDYFFHRQDDNWRREALGKLPALKRSTEMLICGEDLGLVPHCVPDVMGRLGILSMEVQRMPKQSGKDFFHPREAPYLSVVTPSSHDMSTLRGWWREDRERTQRFFTHEMGHYSTAPEECEPWIAREVILQHLRSPAQWCVFQFQDLVGMDARLRSPDPERERINIPADPHHYWRYRMHMGIEQLQGEESFNRMLREAIASSGRTNMQP